MPADRTIEHGILVRQWKWPLRLVFWWVMIGVCVWVYAIAAHWYWAVRAAPDAPAQYSQSVLRAELGALAQLRPRVFEPLQVAERVAGTLQLSVLDVSVGAARALLNWPKAFQARATGQQVVADQADSGASFVAEQLAAGGEALSMLATGTQIFAVRTAVYLAALPLLTALAALALIDGLVARAKRKACAGRESASLYHRAKLGLSFVAILGYVGCVGAPAMANPPVLLIPLGLALAGLLRVQAAFYKKYL